MDREEAIHREFEQECKNEGLTYLSFDRPYMEEHNCGYDSVLTNNMFRGWLLAKGYVDIMVKV